MPLSFTYKRHSEQIELFEKFDMIFNLNMFVLKAEITDFQTPSDIIT